MRRRGGLYGGPLADREILELFKLGIRNLSRPYNHAAAHGFMIFLQPASWRDPANIHWYLHRGPESFLRTLAAMTAVVDETISIEILL